MRARNVTQELVLLGDRMSVKTTYFDDDDTLVIRLSDKPVVREISQDWRTHVSFAADGSVVETVILEAARIGAWPLRIEHRDAA